MLVGRETQQGTEVGGLLPINLTLLFVLKTINCVTLFITTMNLNFLKRNFFFVLFLGLMASTVVSCGSDNEIASVCMTDKAPVYSKPSKKEGTLLSAVSLGEKLTFLDEKEEDEKGKKYLKVKLVDGNEGWILADYVVVKAMPGVIYEKMNIYSRPDLASITKKTLDEMDIIAIVTRKDDWIEIIAKRTTGKGTEKGWIKDKGYSEGTTDLAAAVFITRAMGITQPDERLTELKAVMDNDNLSGSSFHHILLSEIRKIDPTAYPSEEEYMEELQAKAAQEAEAAQAAAEQVATPDTAKVINEQAPQ